jgi:hypothetical protein
MSRTIVVYYSQDVRCGGCGALMRVTGNTQEGLSAKTRFYVSCPSCHSAISCEALRPIVPRNVEMVCS